MLNNLISKNFSASMEGQIICGRSIVLNKGEKALEKGFYFFGIH